MSSRIQELQAFQWYLTEDITTDINIKKLTQKQEHCGEATCSSKCTPPVNILTLFLQVLVNCGLLVSRTVGRETWGLHVQLALL